MTKSACAAVQVFGNGESYNALLWTTFFVSLLTWLLYRLQCYEGDKLMFIFPRKKNARPLLRFKRAHAIALATIAVCLASCMLCGALCVSL